MFSIKNGWKEDVLSSLLFNFSLEYAIRWVQLNQVGFKLNATGQLLFYTVDVNILGGSVHTMKKNTALVFASMVIGSNC